MAKNIVIGQRVEKGKLQQAKELRRRMTAEEKILWRQLRTNRLTGLHIRRQQVIDGFIADFYCHSAGLVIELDGAVHQSQAKYDAERDRTLSQRKLRTLRIKNKEIRENLEGVLARILEACGGEKIT
jgi:very-short-patch-repair endonuclease